MADEIRSTFVIEVTDKGSIAQVESAMRGFVQKVQGYSSQVDGAWAAAGSGVQGFGGEIAKVDAQAKTLAGSISASATKASGDWVAAAVTLGASGAVIAGGLK